MVEQEAREILDLSIFFERNIVIIFFVYGLSFFFIAATLTLSARSLASIGLYRAFSYLLLFAIIHGSVEWMDMYNRYKMIMFESAPGELVLHIRFYMMLVSFYFLLLSGLKLMGKAGDEAAGTGFPTLLLNLTFLLLVIFIAASGLLETKMNEAAGLVRYFLGLPASIIAGVAFMRLSKSQYAGALPRDYESYFRYCAYAFIAYGLFSGVVVPASAIPPATFLNADTFFKFTGVPIQFLRALAAFFLAYFMVKSMGLRISHRLMGTFTMLFLMAVIVGGVGYLNLNFVTKSYDRLIDIEAENKEFSQLEHSFNDLYLLLGKQGPAGEMYNIPPPLLDAYIATFRDHLAMVESREHEKAEEKSLISNISSLFHEAVETGAIKRESLEKVKLLVSEIKALHEKEAKEHREDVTENIRNFNKVLLITLMLSIFSLVFLGRGIMNMIIRPINTLRTGARQISDGNLEHRIDVRTADELQEFAEDFNIMGEKLLERTNKIEATTEALKELSITDGLTGLYNHRYFYKKLEAEIKRADRYSTNLSLLILDVDDFKFYNDKNGHPRGDEVLRRFGSLISENLRDVDVACRYGGEEFAVILIETDKATAINSAERLRAAISGHHFPHEEDQPLGDVTVSIGIASYPADTKDMKELVKKADAALYRAKGEGKNRVYT